MTGQESVEVIVMLVCFVLAALAIGSVMASSVAIASLLLAVGGIATALVMYHFSRRQPSSG